MRANARAAGIKKVSEALTGKGGDDAAALNIAEQYVNAFGQLAKQTNTVILPSNVSDAGGMVAQALSVYKQLTKSANAPLS